MTGSTVAAVAIVGRGFIVCVALLGAACAAQGYDALPWLNAQRAGLGLYPLLPDPELQAMAQRVSDMQADLERMGHVSGGGGGRRGLFRRGGGGGMSGPGRAEGVGMNGFIDPEGRHFYSCLQASTNYRYAGAATTVRNGRTYYTLRLR